MHCMLEALHVHVVHSQYHEPHSMTGWDAHSQSSSLAVLRIAIV